MSKAGCAFQESGSLEDNQVISTKFGMLSSSSGRSRWIQRAIVSGNRSRGTVLVRNGCGCAAVGEVPTFKGGKRFDKNDD